MGDILRLRVLWRLCKRNCKVKLGRAGEKALLGEVVRLALGLQSQVESLTDCVLFSLVCIFKTSLIGSMIFSVIPLESKSMKRQFQFRLSSALIAFAVAAIFLSAYTQRAKALEKFRQIENKLDDFLPRGLDKCIAESSQFEGRQGLTPIVRGISGGGASPGSLFSDSSFDKSYLGKIRFRKSDGSDIWPDGINVNVTVTGKLGIFGHQPEIEILDHGGEYSVLAIDCLVQFFSKEFGIEPGILANTKGT